MTSCDDFLSQQHVNNKQHQHQHQPLSTTTTTAATATAAKKMTTGARDTDVSHVPGIFFFANVLGYAQGATRHNASNWLQLHTR